MESKNTNSDTDFNTNTEQTINFNLDLGFDIKYSTWLKLKESEQKNVLPSEQDKPSTEPILKEEEIEQISQLAKSLGAKGYEFVLNLEPRNSYKKIQVCKQYTDGPYRVSTHSNFMKPLELETYENFDQVVRACSKNKTALSAKYNPVNMLIFQSKGKYYLGFRCHKCDGFKSGYSNKSDPFDISKVVVHDYMEISSPYFVNTDIFCSDCRRAGLSEKEQTYSFELEHAQRYKVNEKSLNLEYSSGGSLSMIHTIGTIYKISKL
jgi:hypothetical protein